MASPLFETCDHTGPGACEPHLNLDARGKCDNPTNTEYGVAIQQQVFSSTVHELSTKIMNIEAKVAEITSCPAEMSTIETTLARIVEQLDSEKVAHATRGGLQCM